MSNKRIVFEIRNFHSRDDSRNELHSLEHCCYHKINCIKREGRGEGLVGLDRQSPLISAK